MVGVDGLEVVPLPPLPPPLPPPLVGLGLPVVMVPLPPPAVLVTVETVPTPPPPVDALEEEEEPAVVMDPVADAEPEPEPEAVEEAVAVALKATQSWLPTEAAAATSAGEQALRMQGATRTPIWPCLEPQAQAWSVAWQPAAVMAEDRQEVAQAGWPERFWAAAMPATARTRALFMVTTWRVVWLPGCGVSVNWASECGW